MYDVIYFVEGRVKMHVCMQSTKSIPSMYRDRFDRDRT